MKYLIILILNLITIVPVYCNVIPVFIHNTIVPAKSSSSSHHISSLFEFGGDNQTSIISSVGIPSLQARILFRINAAHVLGTNTIGDDSDDAAILYAPQIGGLFSREISQGGVINFGYIPQNSAHDSSGVVAVPVVSGLITGISYKLLVSSGRSPSSYDAPIISLGAYLPVNSSVVDRLCIYANSRIPLSERSNLFVTANYDATEAMGCFLYHNTGTVGFLAGADILFYPDSKSVISRFIGIRVIFN